MQPFSLIIPVYNEEEILKQNVGRLVLHCDSLKVPYEILAVSNGSIDKSVEIGQKLEKQYPQFRFFSLSDRGVGRAFKTGIHHSKYANIIFMDADLSADLCFIEKSDQLLDRYVMVLGAKIKGLQDRGWFRKLGSFVFYISVVILMGMKYVDYAPGAKSYRKDFLLRNLKYIDDHTSFVLNLTFVALTRKEPVVETAISCQDHRQSRFNLFHEAIAKYKGLFSLKINQLLGRL